MLEFNETPADKTMLAMRPAFHLATLFGVAACGSYVVPDSHPEYPLIVDTLQSAAEPLAESTLLDIKYAFIDDKINATFNTYARIEFEYYETGALPSPPTNDCNQPAGSWPDVTCLGGVFYYNYAYAHRDTTLPFALFGVNHLTTTDTTVCTDTFTLGTSNVPDPFNSQVANSIPAARRDRFTYIFVKDLDAKARRCSRDAHNAMIFAMVHELGHQRAGLSHSGFDNRLNFNAQPIYHKGKIPASQVDVMIPNPTFNDLTRNVYPFFDAYDSLVVDTTTCQGNLFRARAFH